MTWVEKDYAALQQLVQAQAERYLDIDRAQSSTFYSF